MAQLSMRQKLFFGLGGLSMSLPDMVFTQWIFVRYVKDEQHALAPAAWFGLCVLLARVAGALAEPAIGHWSDTFRSPHGRRMPFVRRGMLPFALAFFLLWTPPLGHLHWVNGAYALAVMLAYLFCFPLVLTPYLALMPEMSTDLGERVTMTTLQAVFIMLGSVAFALMGVVLSAAGWLAVGGTVSILILLALSPLALTFREPPRTPPRENVSLYTSIRWTVSSKPFLCLAVGSSFFMFALTIAIMSLPFWVSEYLHRGEDTVTLLMVPLLGTTMVLFAGVAWAAGRFGKYAIFSASLLGAAVCMLLFTGAGLFPLGSPLVQMLVLLTLIGVPLTGFSALPFALLADIIDYDEKRTGHRREAIFFAVQGTVQKVFVGLAAGCFSILAYWGPGNNVSVTGLRCAMAAAALAAAVGFLVFRAYPLREKGGRIVYHGAEPAPLEKGTAGP